MAILHFKCASCGRVMGATRESAGTQVRCPHCQQIMQVPQEVAAPAADPAVAEPASSAETLPATTSAETLPVIEPTIEMPSPQVFQQFHEVPAKEITDAPVAREMEPATIESPIPTFFNQPSFQGSSPAQESWQGGAASAASEEVQESSPFDKAPSPTAELAKKRTPVGSSMAMMVLFFSLVSYSVLASVLLIIMFFRLNAVPKHPLEFIPDVDGDNPGAKRTKIRFNNDKERTQLKLPAHLTTQVGQAIVVGELEVTPISIEKGRSAVLVSGYEKPEPCKEDSLILRLKLKNISQDQTFSPLDHYFNRHWNVKARNALPPPFTLVQFGEGKPEKSFFGGPAKWNPLALAGSKNSSQLRETVDGCNLDRALEPGEETIATISTDGDDPAVREIFTHQGPMMWRVQVRRGLVSVGNREIPATSVLGILFTSASIKVAAEPKS